MPAKRIPVLDLQDCEAPPIPPRSRLYHLEPVEKGTPFVESLASYVTRLAEAHCVSPKSLVVNEVLPALGREYKTHSDYQLVNELWTKSALYLNGAGSLANEWVRALESLTLWNDLRYLTMLTWSNVVPQTGLLRRTKAWCSLCYEEWYENSQVIYDPLLWAIGPITVCPMHRQSLQCMCPYDDCKKPLSFLTQQSFPGHCSQCGRWLGGFSAQEVTGEELDWQLWVINAVGELLTAASAMSGPPLKEGIAAAITRIVDQLAGGNMSTLARQLQIPVQLIWSWKNAQSLPRFITLLQVCYRLNVAPFRFLTSTIEDFADASDGVVQRFAAEPHEGRKLDKDKIKRDLESVLADDTRPFPPFNEVARQLDQNPRVLQKHFPDLYRSIVERYQNQFSSDNLRNALEAIVMANESPPPNLSEVGRRLGYQPDVLRLNFPDLCRNIVARHREQFNAQQLQHELEEILSSDETPPPSMKEIARRLGYSEGITRFHFPVLCKQISARYLAYWRRSAQARRERICSEVRKVVWDIHSQGKYPGANLVASLLTRPQDMLEEETVKAWHEALQELGLEQ